MAVDFNQIQEILAAAQNAADVEKEVRKSLTRIENLMSAVNQEVQHIYQVFDGAVPVGKTRKPRAPKAVSDNETTGKRKPGRPKRNSEHSSEHPETSTE